VALTYSGWFGRCADYWSGVVWVKVSCCAHVRSQASLCVILRKRGFGFVGIWRCRWVALVRKLAPVAHMDRSSAICDRHCGHESASNFTDPPYYARSIYLSDRFVWLKRVLEGLATAHQSPNAKREESLPIWDTARPGKAIFERMQAPSRGAGQRMEGLVVFAHKITEGWEGLSGMMRTVGP
jgi:hypothetical protein